MHTRTLASSFAAVVALTLVPATSAIAGTGTAATSGGSVTFTFPDVVLDGSGLCFDAPLSATATVKPGVEWFVDVRFRQPGTAPMSSSGRVMGSNSGSATGTIQVCPTDGTGRMLVEGEFTTLEFEPPYTNAEAPISTEFTIAKAASAVSIGAVKSTGSGTRLTGKVTTESATYGTVTTSGDVVAQFRAPGKRAWSKLGKGYAAKDGFTVTSSAKVPARSQIRVSFLGNDAVLPSTATR